MPCHFCFSYACLSGLPFWFHGGMYVCW